MGVPDGVLPPAGRGGSRSRADADDAPVRSRRCRRAGPCWTSASGAARPRCRWRGRAGSIGGIDQQPDMLEGFLAHAAAAGVEARDGHGRVARGRARRRPSRRRRLRARLLQRPGARTVRRARSTRTPAAASSSSSPSGIRSTWMRDLWHRFHGLERPDGPTADDAVAVLADLGLQVGREERLIAGGFGGGGFARREDAIHWSASGCACPPNATPRSRRRSADGCGSATASGTSGRRHGRVVTLWWDR